MAAKKKIAILGGGIGGLVTALELTNDPNWKNNFEITVYQMGWRLGGKCATGRGPNGRIEEHGIHLFGGGYYNALGMMSAVYDELNLPPGGWPMQFKDAFKRQYLSLNWDESNPARTPNATDFPPNGFAPEDGARFRSVISMLAALTEFVERLFERNFSPGQALSDILHLPPSFLALAKAVPPVIPMRQLLASLKDNLSSPGFNPELALRQLAEAREWTHDWLVPSNILESFLSNDLKEAFNLADFALAIASGVLMDLIVKRKTFDDLDRQNFAEWLRSHGASAATVETSIAQAPINILYAYPNSDHANAPSLGAGAYLHWTLRTFAYLGAPLWLFAAGSGETLIAPLYEVLKRRGVAFNFFHKVEKLALSTDGSAVDAVEVSIQATLKSSPYEPLVKVGALQCWPAAPLYDQLKEGEELRAKSIDLESYWSDWKPPTTLTLKAGHDFHQVVFAISLGAVPHLCQELLAKSPAWRNMVGHIKTAQTQSLQVWLNQSSKDLGLNIKPRDLDDTAIGCGFEAPFDGLADFSPLIGFEGWPAANLPAALWYFSDVLPQKNGEPPDFTQTDYPQRRRVDVRANSIAFLDAHMTTLLPRAGVTPSNAAFNFNLLSVHDTSTGKGKVRIDQQVYRANIQPSERYVMSPVNSTQFRLKAWESGFKNLVIAGDWIYTGLNVGCVEATVMSGKLASFAISQKPALDTIIGYNPPTN